MSTPLSITTTSPSQGSKNGGENITINGQGFHYNNLDLINVTICEQRAKILFASNIKVIIEAPPCETVGQTQIMFRSGS